MAASRTFLTSRAMRRFEKVRSASAFSALWPRIMAATRFSFRGLVRSILPTARASFSSRIRSLLGLPIRLSPLRLLVGRMAVEGPSRREFAELVTHHVLGHQHRQELLAVVDAEVRPTNCGMMVER